MSTKALSTSWAEVSVDPQRFVETFYANLFAGNPELRASFPHDMTAHNRKFASTFQRALELLEAGDLATLRRAIAALAERHAHLGLARPHFDIVGAALLDTVAALSENALAETRRAWAEAFELIASTMLEALADRDAAMAPPMGAAQPA